MTEARSTQRRFRLSGLIDAGMLLLALGLCLPWLSAWLAQTELLRLAWFIDLGSHWQWLFAALLTLCAVLRALQGAHSRLLALCLLWLPWCTASPRLTEAAASTPSPTLRIAAINLLVSNTDASGLRAFLDRVKPDIVVLTELHPDVSRVASTWADYPEHHLSAEDSPFGIGVLSRLPLQDAQSQLDRHGLPEIDIRLIWQKRAIMLTALHPMPPITARWHQARTEKLQAAAKRQSGFPGGKLLVGDLNASPWSSAIRPLRGSYARANSLQPTWPSDWFGKLGIPIDLILASPEFAVQQFQVEPAFGSDHHPVWADLTLLPATTELKTP